jgi:hypothetical protein
LFPSHPPRPRAATLAELDAIVASSSEKNRNFFTAYLGLLIYVQAIVFSTTDLQFLTGRDIELPIVALPVPLVGFYVVVPIFVIALHFNFLQNLESHHYKLMRWQDAHPGGRVPRGRLQAFLFDYATLETGSQMENWVRWANNILCLNLAPITLGLLLWRYTDRQDAPVTLWLYACFVFDCFLVWKLRRGFAENKKANAFAGERFGTGWLAWPATALRFVRDIPRQPPYGLIGLLVLLETLLAVFVAEAPSDPFVRYGLPLTGWIEARGKRIASLALPRIAIDPAETVWRPDAKELETDARLAGETDWAKYFYARVKAGWGPVTQHLRLVRLESQRLPRADFRNAQMDGAFLWGAQLQGAELGNTHLQGAVLMFARLEGAGLSPAYLQGADLARANLQGADVSYAYLQGADVSYAQLQGADVSYAQLQGADLSGADLQGAIAKKTGFQGAAASNSSGAWLLEPPFDPSSVNWDAIEKLAAEIPDAARKRQAFLERIQAAKTRPSGEAEKSLRHDAGAVHREVLPAVCQAKDSDNRQKDREFRRSAAWGIRRNYIRLKEKLGDIPELSSTMTEIDRTLCTLPACADLRNDIDGLDCGPFTNKKSP